VVSVKIRQDVSVDSKLLPFYTIVFQWVSQCLNKQF